MENNNNTEREPKHDSKSNSSSEKRKRVQYVHEYCEKNKCFSNKSGGEFKLREYINGPKRRSVS